jgi:hypothetical protein
MDDAAPVIALASLLELVFTLSDGACVVAAKH